MQPQIDAIRAVTVRLPARVLSDAKGIAARRHLSFNALVRLALEKMAADERQEQLRASYDTLGSDQDEGDVERYLHAQSDVVRRG